MQQKTLETGGDVVDIVDLFFLLEKLRTLSAVPLKINQATVSQRSQLRLRMLRSLTRDSEGGLSTLGLSNKFLGS